MLFPLDEAEKFLKGTAPDLERRGSTLTFRSHDGVTELSVRATNYTTYDDLKVSEEVIVSHRSPRFDQITPQAAANLNAFASLSSIVPATNDAPGKLVCKTGIFSADKDAAARLYAPLLCTEAAVVGWYAACLGRARFKIDPNKSPLSRTNEHPPYDRADFEAVHALAAKQDLMASYSEKGFSVEFPWDPGAYSAMFRNEGLQERARTALKLTDEELEQMGGQTSLLQLLEVDHPLLGKGIQSRLEIPIVVSRNETTDTRMLAIVSELNLWELGGLDLPPMFGAWCCGPRAPTFVSFYPTQYCLPALLFNLISWARVRHNRARQWLGASSTKH